MISLKKEITILLKEYKSPKRQAFSKRFPTIKNLSVFFHRFVKKINNSFQFNISRNISNNYFDNTVAKHQSLLLKKLGNTNISLQKNKIKNLEIALSKINKIIIKPNETFSLWETIGRPSYKNGYVDGMLLSNGKVIEGVGGGLCQLSNLLHWLFLHTPLEITERHHHSFDVFPDSGRVLPFGSGATIFYNYLDLKVTNISTNTFQIKIWLTNNHLKGQILSLNKEKNKYHIYEKNHFFVKDQQNYFRYNQIYRQTLENGKILNDEKIITNFAPILYIINDNYLRSKNHQQIIL